MSIAQEVTIELSAFMADGICHSSQDGERVFTTIQNILEKHQKIHLSFSGVQVITPTFLNHSIGQLYAHFSVEEIRQFLTIVNAAPDQLELIKRVVDNAKLYFASKKKAS